MLSIEVRHLHPASVAAVWDAASHPGKLVRAVPMLRDFHAPPQIRTGTELSETHSILGIPQAYRGTITQYDLHRRWAMTSAPVVWGLFSLPHDVTYEFEQKGESTEVRILCKFRCEGLLSLPLVSGIVAWFMRRTLEAMQVFIASRVSQHGASECHA